MKRRAFTLIELLVIIGLLGILSTVAVMSVQKGRDMARLKGSVRDVFATVRIARSVALVTQKPSIITFSTKNSGDSCVSHVEIESSDLIKTSTVRFARTLDGKTINLDTGSVSDRRETFDADAQAAAVPAGEGGESIEEILFSPVSDEVFESIRLKVVMDDEQTESTPGEVDEAKKSMISTFSNVDYLLGAYRDERKKKAEEEMKSAAGREPLPEPAAAASAAAGEETEKSLVWQVNGRCDPHTVYVYVDGTDFQEGWKIHVDRFGSAKIYSPEEDWR